MCACLSLRAALPQGANGDAPLEVASFAPPTCNDMLDVNSIYCSLYVKNTSMVGFAPRASQMNSVIECLLAHTTDDIDEQHVMPIWSCSASVSLWTVLGGKKSKSLPTTVPTAILKQMHRQLVEVSTRRPHRARGAACESGDPAAQQRDDIDARRLVASRRLSCHCASSGSSASSPGCATSSRSRRPVGPRSRPMSPR